MHPIVVRQLHATSRRLGYLKVAEGGKDEVQVTEITISHKVIRHMENIDHYFTQSDKTYGEY
jgi:hypothetical protein